MKYQEEIKRDWQDILEESANEVPWVSQSLSALSAQVP